MVNEFSDGDPAQSETTAGRTSFDDDVVWMRVRQQLAIARTWTLVCVGVGMTISALAVIHTALYVLALGGIPTSVSMLQTLFAMLFPALIYAAPSVMLIRYAKHIKRHLDTQSGADCVEAFAIQRRFWISTLMLPFCTLILFVLILFGASTLFF